jgi:glycosyltransferase involved in cell wall biosynthesis
MISKVCERFLPLAGLTPHLTVPQLVTLTPSAEAVHEPVREAADVVNSAIPYKVAYLIGHLRTGGAQKHLLELMGRLDRARFAPRIYCLRREGVMVKDFGRLGIEVEDLRIGNSLAAPRSLARLFDLARSLREQRISILHCYLPRANFFGAIAARLARVPVLLVSKRSLDPPQGLKQLLRCRLADGWADGVLANSPEALRYAIDVEHCRPAKTHLVVNGIDVNRYCNPAIDGPSCPQPVVGTVMRLEAVKGPDTFVQAAGRVAREMPSVRFVIVGDGSMRRRLESDAVKLGLGNRIQFMGERHDVADILPSFSVFLLPSRIEGMSMALLEAMAAGRPVVATRVGGNVDLVRDGETGLLVSPQDPEEMSHAVLRFLREPAWAQRIGRDAQKLVQQHYSADSMVRRIERIYAELLHAKHTDRAVNLWQTPGANKSLP